MIKQEIKIDKNFLQKFENYLNTPEGDFYYEENFIIDGNKTLKVVFYDVNDVINKFVRIKVYLLIGLMVSSWDITINSKDELFGVHKRTFKSEDFTEVLLLKISLSDEKPKDCLLKYYFKINDLNKMMNIIEFNSFDNPKELVESLAVITHLYPLLNKYPQELIADKKDFIINKLMYFGYDEEYLEHIKTRAGISYIDRLISWALEAVYNNNTKQIVNDVLLIDAYNAILI